MAMGANTLSHEQARDPAVGERNRKTAIAFSATAFNGPLRPWHTQGEQCDPQRAAEEAQISEDPNREA
jgi:hypothetical protein